MPQKNTVNKAQYFAVFSLLYSAICWGVVWYPYRLLYEAGISGIASSFYTYTLALLIAGVFYIKHWKGIFKVPRSILALCFAAGFTNVAYVLAVLEGEVMRVMLLFYLSPIWTLILAHFWLKERTNLRGVIVILIALMGAFIMLFDVNLHKTHWVSYLPLPQNTAEWIALFAGIGFSLTNVITRKSTHLNLQEKSFAVWFGVVVTCLLILPLLNETLPSPVLFSIREWLLMVLVALMLISATVFVQYGVTKMTASRASVIFLFELVVAAVAAYYLANEIMVWNEWLGGGLIIIASMLSSNHTHD